MRILACIIALFTGLISISGQDIGLDLNKKSPIRYSIKTNPLSPITGAFKIIMEQSIHEKISLEYELGYRRQNWDRENKKTHAGFVSVRPKYYFTGQAQKGIYVSPGISYEYYESKLVNEDDWTAKSVFAGFVDLGVQMNLKKIVLEFFCGIGGMTDSPGGYIDIGEPYGTHWGFGNHLIYRGGLRIGIAI